MKPMIIKPVRTRCQVTMCSNIGANQIARTAGPGNMAICICDECLLEAVRIRFGDVVTGADAEILRMNADNHLKHNQALIQRSKAQEELIKALEEKADALQELNATMQDQITLLKAKAAEGTPDPEEKIVPAVNKKGTGKK